MLKTITIAAALAFALGGSAFAQNNSKTVKNNIDAGGGKGLVVVDVNLNETEVEALNDLIDVEDNNIAIPATVQVPLTVAANICGVAVNVIAQNNDQGDKTCEATAASQALADVITQQTQ